MSNLATTNPTPWQSFHAAIVNYSRDKILMRDALFRRVVLSIAPSPIFYIPTRIFRATIRSSYAKYMQNLAINPARCMHRAMRKPSVVYMPLRIYIHVNMFVYDRTSSAYSRNIGRISPIGTLSCFDKETSAVHKCRRCVWRLLC